VGRGSIDGIGVGVEQRRQARQQALVVGSETVALLLVCHANSHRDLQRRRRGQVARLLTHRFTFRLGQGLRVSLTCVHYSVYDANMQVKTCRVRDLNPHNVTTSTSTYAGHGAFCEHLCDRRMPVNDGSGLLRVSNGHSHLSGGAVNVYTLTIDLIGSVIDVDLAAPSPENAARHAHVIWPEARSVTVSGVREAA